VALLAAALLVAQRLPEGKGTPIAWQDLTSRVGPIVIVRSEHRLFRDRHQLAGYLKSAQARRAAPAVDFRKRQLLLVSPGPRSSTGYSVQILGVTEHGGKITVAFRERTPSLGERASPRVTYPYRLLSLPAGKDVYVDQVGR
jgi:hypothetical protein